MMAMMRVPGFCELLVLLLVLAVVPVVVVVLRRRRRSGAGGTCASCGARLRPGSRFCHECGADRG
ncbi:MAG: zinc-ribbon domain-containing protein [Kiritimatiellae bacterium]|nr:zinc-ribbon domain-containing protein [Kiritimatiellia bacterium]